MKLTGCQEAGGSKRLHTNRRSTVVAPPLAFDNQLTSDEKLRLDADEVVYMAGKPPLSGNCSTRRRLIERVWLARRAAKQAGVVADPEFVWPDRGTPSDKLEIKRRKLEEQLISSGEMPSPVPAKRNLVSLLIVMLEMEPTSKLEELHSLLHEALLAVEATNEDYDFLEEGDQALVVSGPFQLLSDLTEYGIDATSHHVSAARTTIRQLRAAYATAHSLRRPAAPPMMVS